MSDRNVVLTGFMGTGKTTVGRAVAELLGFEFVDTDDVIVERHGPIPAIFSELGEDAFRQFERDVAAELAGATRLVISTGGRLMVDRVNAEQLGATGDVVCLTASIDTILDRVSGDGTDQRPMLAGCDTRERLERLLAERAPAYAAFSPVVTDDRDPVEVARAVIEVVRPTG